MITIKHSSNLQLGYKKLREWVFREFSRACKKRGLQPPVGLHMNVEFLQKVSESFDTKEKIMQYIRKNSKPLDLDGKGVYYSGKQGSRSKKSQEYVPFSEPAQSLSEEDEPEEEETMDERLSRLQEQQNDELLDRGYDSDQEPADYDSDGFEDPELDEPVPLKPAKVPFVKLQLPKF
jgi:hypothetical protein